MKTKKLILIVVIAVIIIIFNASCITPKGALRTQLFLDGHPVIAFITPITDDDFHNKIDRELLKAKKAHCYELIIPVRDKVTGNYLTNYIVRKEGFFYYAEYYGEA